MNRWRGIMMEDVKNVVSAIFAALFVLGIGLTAFADDAKVTKDDDSIFQKMSDLINDKYEVKTVPFKTMGIFQSMADNIQSLTRDSESK